MESNAFEKTILNWIMEKYADPILTQQINNIQVKNRDYTGSGFLIEIEIDDKIPKLNESIFNTSYISGPAIRSSGIQYDGGSILFHENGKLNLLELFANGRTFQEDISDFTLAESFDFA